MSLSPPVGARDHVQGDAAAPVTLVEYGDYQCPYCGPGPTRGQGVAEADRQEAALRLPTFPARPLPRFEAALTSRKLEARVAEDFKSGVRSGVNGTPTFFINGVRYDGDWTSAETLGAALEAAIHR